MVVSVGQLVLAVRFDVRSGPEVVQLGRAASALAQLHSRLVHGHPSVFAQGGGLEHRESSQAHEIVTDCVTA